jgi:hypothetical protein
MNKEFIPYEQALELIKLGFDEKCIAWYPNDSAALSIDGVYLGERRSGSYKLLAYAPLYQQAFRWFREKHGLVGITKFGTQEFTYNIYNIDGIGMLTKESLSFNGTYEEAELACLKKLIEIVKGGDK